MKRFYKTVDIAETREGYTVRLDGRPVRTPARKQLIVPNGQLAEAVAAEWRNQTDRVDPSRMPHTRMLTVITDQDASARARHIEKLRSYGASDLLCYRAEQPAKLTRRQSEVWDPYLGWLGSQLGIRLRVTTGIVPVVQPDGAIDRLIEVIEKFDNYHLAAIDQMTHLTGSLVLSLALVHGQADLDSVWSAATLDEDFQAETWGLDDDEDRRRTAIRQELDDAFEFLQLLQQADVSACS